MPIVNNTIRVVPPYGVSIDDVRTALGLTSRDLGTLCKDDAGKIQKWSRYRPIRLASFGPLTDNDRKAVNFGYSFSTYSNLLALFNDAVDLGADGEAWNAAKPRGISGVINEPFRLLDFDGYVISEQYAPFQYVLWPMTATIFDTITAQVRTDKPMSGQYQQSDFVGSPNLSEMYIGCAFRKHGAASSVQPLAFTIESGTPLDIKNYLQERELYDVAFFFSSVPITLSGGSVSGTFVPTPIPYSTITYDGSISGAVEVPYAAFDNPIADPYRQLTVKLRMKHGTKTFDDIYVTISYEGTQYTHHLSEGGSNAIQLTEEAKTFTIVPQSGEMAFWKLYGGVLNVWTAQLHLGLTHYDLPFSAMVIQPPQ